MIIANVIKLSDVARCPKASMLPAHFRRDGSCRCDEAQEALDHLTKLHKRRRALARRIQAAEAWVAST